MMENEKEIRLELVITNPNGILETAKRLKEISGELELIAYKLQVKQGYKELQPSAGTEGC